MTTEGIQPGTTPQRSRRMGLAAFAVMLIVVTVSLPAWGLASTVRSEQDVSVAVGETIDDDLYVLSNTFALDGRVEGEVVVAARDIDIGGSIGGSLNATGGDVTISGTVERSVRLLSGRAEITGSIGGDLLVLGGTVDIDPSADIAGDVRVYGGTLDADGTVRGDISGSISNLAVDGRVGGDVSVDVERLEVGPGTVIDGELSYVSPRDASIDGSAVLSGAVDRASIAPWGIGSDFRARFFSPLVRTVWLLAAGAMIIALAPRLSLALNDNMRRPLVAGLTGIIALVAVPFLAILLLVTIVGIPVSLLLLVAYFTALYLSQYIVGQRIGSIILPRRWNDGSRGYLLLSMTIGVLILSVLRFVPVPFVSNIVNALVAVLGLGAACLLVRQFRPSAGLAARSQI